MSINQDKARSALSKAGDNLITQLQAAMESTGANATGKTSRSLDYQIKFGTNLISFQLTGGPGWAFVEAGRGPTKNSGPGDLYPAIVEWCIARGIDPEAASAITNKIHAEGTLFYREGIRRIIFGQIITREGVNRIAQSVGILGSATIASEVVNALK